MFFYSFFKYFFMSRQVKTNYDRLRDADLGYLASTVLQAMGQNSAVFANPVPPLTDLEQVLADYNEKMDLANKKGSPEDAQAKNAARDVLVDTLRRLAFYVNTVAKGVLHQLLSSGFRLRDLPSALTVPGIPQRVRMVDGDVSGELALLFDAVHKASHYEYELGTMAGDIIVWEKSGTVRSGRKRRHNIISPLIRAMTYYVRVRACNAHGKGDWSTPVSQVAR